MLYYEKHSQRFLIFFVLRLNMIEKEPGKRFSLPEVRKSMLCGIADTKTHGMNLIKMEERIFLLCFSSV